MKRRIHLVGAALVLLAPIYGQAAEINLLCSANVNWCELMKQRFEAETKITVNFEQKSAGSALEMVRAEKNAPKHDIWFGGSGEPHMEAAKETLTEHYRSPSLGQLEPWAVRQGIITYNRSVGVYAGVVVVGINEKVMKEKKLPEPRCWKDLAKPEYRGLVVMPNPNSSGTAYTAMATWVQIFGESPAFDYMRELNKNIVNYPKGGSGPGEAVASGEAAIGISYAHDLTRQMAKGAPIKLVMPCEGTGYEVGSMSLIKGARNMEAAKRFYEFALRADVQGLSAEVKQFVTPANRKTPVHKLAVELHEVRLIAYDHSKYGLNEVRAPLIKRWSDEIGPKKDESAPKSDATPKKDEAAPKKM